MKQRLACGRRTLKDAVMAWVEGALRRAVPGAAFIHIIVHALPVSSAVDGISTGVVVVSPNAAATDNAAAVVPLVEMRFGSAPVLSTES